MDEKTQARLLGLHSPFSLPGLGAAADSFLNFIEGAYKLAGDRLQDVTGDISPRLFSTDA